MAEKLTPAKIDGGLTARGLRFGIVVSRFNSFITERLLAAAVDALERAGAASKDVDVVRVPGSFEVPPTEKKLAWRGASMHLSRLVASSVARLRTTITSARKRRADCSSRRWIRVCRLCF